MAEKQRIEENISFITSMDPELGEAVRKEYDRQCRNIELIASENIVSPTVMAAVNVLTLQRIWQSSAYASCSAQSMQTYSRTPAHRQTWLFIRHCASRATRFSA